MITTRHPYEFLARWDAAGRLSGAHVGWRYVTLDDAGVTITESVTPVEPVDIGAGKGFPLTDILSRVLADTLVERDRLMAERETLIAERDADRAARARAEAGRDAAIVARDALTAV